MAAREVQQACTQSMSCTTKTGTTENSRSRGPQERSTKKVLYKSRMPAPRQPPHPRQTRWWDPHAGPAATSKQEGWCRHMQTRRLVQAHANKVGVQPHANKKVGAGTCKQGGCTATSKQGWQCGHIQTRMAVRPHATKTVGSMKGHAATRVGSTRGDCQKQVARRSPL